ncbi:S-adenosyl-L-methionine-dependent methyltransferase [Mycena capillaripes]|nr:S-adenosyl-L-methionine-dependent methyltransferase [Mycena capillaripes]
MGELQKDFEYTLKTAQDIPEKDRRVQLDELHIAVREFLDNKISFAPIYGTSLTRILELGCGSGAWVIDAANDFPDAEVVAVDLSPTLQGIPLPKNVSFKLVDVTQSFPFKENSFDVVHARFLLMHLPNAKDVIERAVKLVKPGGWLILEDINLCTLIESGGSMTSQVMALWAGIIKAQGADADIGREMEAIIQSTGSFSEIHTRKVTIPLCHDGSAPQNLARMGEVFKTTLKKLVAGWTKRFPEQVSEDIPEKVNKQMDDNSREVKHDLHFVWARRAL